MKVQVALVGTGGDLDCVLLEVKDDSDCAREVIAAVTRERWVLASGDRIEIRAVGH
jgi:hypothetical protein